MNRLASLVASLALLGAGGGVCAQSKPAVLSPAETLRKADAHYDAGELLQAEPLYRQLARPTPPARGARAATRQAISRKAHERLLTLYPRLGRSDRAVRAGLVYLGWLRRLDERAAIARVAFQLGENYLVLGHVTRAATWLNEALGRPAKESNAGPGKDLLPLPQQLAAWAYLARIAEKMRALKRAETCWRQVERLARSGLADRRDPPSAEEKAFYLRRLADAYRVRKDSARAIGVLKDLLPLQERARDWDGKCETQRALAACHGERKDHARAEAALRQALTLAERIAEAHPLRRADVLVELAEVLERRKSAAEAGKVRKSAIKAYRAVLEKHREGRSSTSASAAEAFWKLERLYERSKLYHQALAVVREQGPLWTNTPVHVRVKAEEGSLLVLTTTYKAARPALVAALADLESQNPPDLLEYPRTLNALAIVEQVLGKPARALALGEKCLALYRRHSMPQDATLAETYNVLGTAAALTGEYARAFVHYRAGIDVAQKVGSIADAQHSVLLLNSAILHRSQGDLDAALKTGLKARALYARVSDPDALGYAAFDAALASLHAALGKYLTANELTAGILKTCKRYKILGGPLVVTARHCQALYLLQQRRPAAAEKVWKALLTLQEEERDDVLVPRTLNYLGLVAEGQGRTSDAEKLYNRAVKLQERAGGGSARSMPVTHFISLWRLAEILHAKGQDKEACRTLEKGIEVAESARVRLYGDARQRTTFFAQFVMGFEQLVDWHVRAGRLEDAVRIAVRGRSRSLFDQLQLCGVDPRRGLEGKRGQQLREREASLSRRTAAIQARARLIPERDADSKEAVALGKELAQVQKDHAAVWREILNASAFYRSLAADQGDTLATLRKHVLRRDNALLLYWIGRDRSYLFLVRDARRPLEVFPLTVPGRVDTLLTKALTQSPGDKKAAGPLRTMRIRRSASASKPAARLPAAPLDQDATRLLVQRYLAHILDSDFRTTRNMRLTRSTRTDAPLLDSEVPAAAFLPRAVLERLRALRLDHILVVPDGALHQLPLEGLLVRAGKNPRYVLDELPPLVYSPSAAVLAMLARRSAQTVRGAPSLLTVGNVAYDDPKVSKPGSLAKRGALEGEVLLALRGVCPALPHTGPESRRIRKLFAAGKVNALEGARATERAAVGAMRGKRYLHLATHGFVTEQHGNLFGALAFAPPGQGRSAPDNDGFLMLHEIYRLPLGGCELAALSACSTNVGPQQPLEAGISLASGFLAAGARRVVASHWCVEDQSTAELMGTFFEQVVKAGGGKAVSYARALHKARQKVRAQKRWSSPAYWAPFVLIGTAE
jgi:CHAT domain-containing protein/tetratricopeptide (TPR) repeat protein